MPSYLALCAQSYFTVYKGDLGVDLKLDNTLSCCLELLVKHFLGW